MRKSIKDFPHRKVRSLKPSHRLEGVYLLYRSYRLIYVGFTSGLKARLAGHWIRFDTFRFIRGGGTQLEAALIYTLQPSKNVNQKNYPDYIVRDLKKYLPADLKRK